MDQNFLASEGFQAPEAVKRETAKVITRASQGSAPTTHKPVTAAKTPNDAVRQAIGGAALGISQLGQKPTTEDKTISGLQKVRELGNSVWAPGWMMVGNIPMPLPVLPAAGWLASKLKLKNVATAIDMPLKAITETLSHVKVQDLHKAPSHMIHTASAVAEASEGKLMQRTAAPLAKAAAATEGFMGNLAKNIGSFTAPVREGFGSMMGRMSGSGRVGSAIANGAQKALASIGKSNLFVAAVATAATAGTLSTFMTANKDRKQANAMLEEIKAQIGADHPIVLEAQHRADKRVRTGLLGSLVGGAGEFLGVKMARGMTLVSQKEILAAQGKLGMVSMGLMLSSGMIVTENELLQLSSMAMHGELKGEDLGKAYTAMLSLAPKVNHEGKPLNLYRMGQALAKSGASFKEVAHLVVDKPALLAAVDKVNAEYASKNKVLEQHEAGVSSNIEVANQPHLQADNKVSTITHGGMLQANGRKLG